MFKKVVSTCPPPLGNRGRIGRDGHLYTGVCVKSLPDLCRSAAEPGRDCLGNMFSQPPPGGRGNRGRIGRNEHLYTEAGVKVLPDLCRSAAEPGRDCRCNPMGNISSQPPHPPGGRGNRGRIGRNGHLYTGASVKVLPDLCRSAAEPGRDCRCNPMGNISSQPPHPPGGRGNRGRIGRNGHLYTGASVKVVPNLCRGAAEPGRDCSCSLLKKVQNKTAS